MDLLVEVTDNGTLKVKSPSLTPGTAFVLPVETGSQETLVESKWDALESALDEAENLDIPRRTHDDILQQLRSYRE